MDSIKAFVFGVTLAVAVGPIAILIINRGLVYGFRSGMLSGVGAALADLTYALVAFTVGSIIVSYLNMNQVYFSWLASGVLIIFGLWMLVGSLKINATANDPNNSALQKGDFGYLTSTYLLTVVNPLTIIAFFGFSGQLVKPSFGVWQVLSMSIAIFLGSIIIQTMLATFGASLGRYIQNPKTIQVLNIFSSLFIIGFGLIGMLKV
ncbi:LysE family transporter [Pontibacter sp. FD36]|uniref:LysE family translocator n=1 Tax=Pontibacter sp. FD36 TaxID=2789860 RepID=UPI0018AA146E|nr:LysE family transporter [Pontibacter sp. FD36]MBF8962480.1 LysE family transporter [Pontibacter sp. FD36]